MLRNLMEDKCLDFDAPLLSVRRFSAPPEVAPAAASAGAATPIAASAPFEAGESGRTRRSSLPFYKSDLKSGPVRNPGVVPFVWEQTPGLPKDGGPRPPGRPPAVPKLPPARSARTRRPTPAAPPVASDVRISDSSGDSAEKVREEEKEEKQPPSMPPKQLPAAAGNEEEEDDDDAFTDALDTLSRTESFFMNCSVSGISGIRDAVEVIPPSGSFATDPQVRDFMMGRFLPAAQAVAASSPQCAPRKQRELVRLVEREESGEHRRLPMPLPYRYGDNFVSQFARGQEEDGDVDNYDDEEDEDYDGAGNLSSKACGLLPRFCLKSSFCLLNPVPGMKARGRVPLPSGRRAGNPQLRNLFHGPLGTTEDENSWEAVYKYKSGSADQHPAEVESKLTSESNHLTYWSDSQTADGSSPYRRSLGGAVSPYRNEATPSPFYEGKSFLGVPRRERRTSGTDGSGSFEKDGDNYLELMHHDGSLQGSGSMSPAIEKTVYVDTVHMPEAPHSKLISVGANPEAKGMTEPEYTNVQAGGMSKSVVKDCQIGVVTQTMDDSIVLEICDNNQLRPKASELIEPDLPICSERSDFQDVEENNRSKHKDDHEYPMPLKTKDQLENKSRSLPSLLPPPLPKSPSESWLCRTLPSVSSKNPPQQSFLGIKFQPKKQALQATTTDSKQEINRKTVKQQRQIRFADMLTKPLSSESD